MARFVLLVSTETAHGLASTIFVVERDTPGMTWGPHPKFTNHALYGHPELTLKDVRVGAGDVLGQIGGGISLTQDWFREERLMIAWGEEVGMRVGCC